MQRKLLNIYMLREGNSFKLRLVEMQQLDNSTPVFAFTRMMLFANESDITQLVDDMFDGIYEQNDVFEGRDIALVDYINSLPGDREELKVSIKKQLKDLFFFRISSMDWLNLSFMDFNNTGFLGNPDSAYMLEYSHDFIHDRYHPNQEYTYHDLTISIPAKQESMFSLLVCVDSMIHALKTYGTKHQYDIHISYCDQIPDFANKSSVIGESVLQRATAVTKKLPALSRYLSDIIVKEAGQSPIALAAYQYPANTLETLLATYEPSLTPGLYATLYPTKSIHASLNAKGKNGSLMAVLLDPMHHFLQSTEQLMSWLKPELTKNPLPITSWFNELLSTRKELWENTIKSLYGQQAPDGGFYIGNYTEINVLLTATMHLNHAGAMELDIYNTEAYKEHYAPGQPFHAIFENEMRAACHHLGLTFLDHLDFHKKIIFTPESSRTLMDRGMHYSEDYAKALMRTLHRFRLFANDLRLPRDMKVMLMKEVEPALLLTEVTMLAGRKAGL